jgi:hypothetical protein
MKNNNKKEGGQDNNNNKNKVTKGPADEVYLEERILIPDTSDYDGIFSWRKLWLFTGPGWLSKIRFEFFSSIFNL